jgi:hypothetical protein
LVNLCRLACPQTKYQLLFLIATLSFREQLDVSALRTLIAFTVFPELKQIDLPSCPSYTQFRPNFYPKPDFLKALLENNCVIPFKDAGMQSRTQKERRAIDTARQLHETEAAQDLESLVDSMCTQWPCPLPDVQNFPTSKLDLTKAISLIATAWHDMFRSHEFEEHLGQIQDILDRKRAHPPTRVTAQMHMQTSIPEPRGFPTVQTDILNKEVSSSPIQQIFPAGPKPSRPANNSLWYQNQDVDELQGILNESARLVSSSHVRKEYIRGLQRSIDALRVARARPQSQRSLLEIGRLEACIGAVSHAVATRMEQLVKGSQKNEPGAMWLEIADMWPVVHRTPTLENLRTTSNGLLADSMRRAITDLGVEITQLQRLLRIRDAHLRGKIQQIDDEVKNPGHTNWDPVKYGYWLLFEVDANILIRPVQADVAFQIISPISKTNSVLQLNMGQGKTSTIIPLVASVLADGKSLCRIVVPKALLQQTALLLQIRLGGLLGRELRFVPFSRRTPSASGQIQAYHAIHSAILKSSGVIIALPEHLISFTLSGQQRLMDGELKEATEMIKVQRWLTTKMPRCLRRK